MLNKTYLFIIVFVTFFMSLVFGIEVNATTKVPTNFILSAENTKKLVGSNYIEGINLNYQKKITSTGKLVYCIERTDEFTKTQENYTNIGTADPGLTYILENGYPNVSLTGNDDEDYWITGIAIWYYLEQDSNIWRHFDFSNNTYRGNYNKNVAIINNLVNGAKTAKKENTFISINKKSKYIKLNNEGTYYVSSKLTVDSKNINTFKAYVSNTNLKAFIGDKNGNVKNDFESNESFYVYIPIDEISSASNLQINVEAISIENQAYIYAPDDSDHQSVVSLYSNYIEVDDKETLVVDYVEPKITKVSILKLDSSNQNNVAGATLELRDNSGTTIRSWITRNEAKVFEGLEFGTYYIVETNAPEGYSLNSEPVKFILSEDNYEETVVIYNSLLPLPENPKTGIADVILPCTITISSSGLALNRLKKNKKFKQF